MKKKYFTDGAQTWVQLTVVFIERTYRSSRSENYSVSLPKITFCLDRIIFLKKTLILKIQALVIEHAVCRMPAVRIVWPPVKFL